MPWQSEDAFRESAGKVSGGLPKKHIHVDSTPTIPDSLRTAGLLYQAEASECAAQKPALLCPSCGETATDIAGAKQIYQVDVPETGGKSHKGDVPPCPVSGLELPPMLYTVEPCGCRVSQEWAGSFSAEMQSRLMGGAPKAVVDMSAKQRAKKLAHYEDRLSALYSLQAIDNPPETREAIDYWIVICADQIQRLSPGDHNKKPMAKPLSGKVADWAGSNGFATPPKPEAGGKLGVALNKFFGGWNPFELDDPSKPTQYIKPPVIDAGVPLYRMTDGTVSPHPAYPNQEPCGIAQGPPSGEGKVPMAPKKLPKVVFQPPTDQDAMDALQLAAMLGSDSLKAKMIAGATAKPTQPDLPTIEETRNKQFAVRHGDIYKVFTKLDDAQEYAQQLANLTPGYAKQMKPKPQLQTLPVQEPPLNIFGATKEEKAPYLDAAKETFKDQLKKVLKATEAKELPVELLKRIVGYTYSHQQVCQQVAEQAFGMHGTLISQVEILLKIRTDLQEYVAGKRTALAVTSTKFVKMFVDLVEFDAIEPAKVEKPQGGVPPGAGAAAIPVPPPPVEKHVKKKRTIRKIED